MPETKGGQHMSMGIKAKTTELRALQRSLKKNDSGMAELIGCTRKTYRNAIDGENVSAGFMAKVSVAFNVPFDTYFHTAPAAEPLAA